MRQILQQSCCGIKLCFWGCRPSRSSAGKGDRGNTTEKIHSDSCPSDFSLAATLWILLVTPKLLSSVTLNTFSIRRTWCHCQLSLCLAAALWKGLCREYSLLSGALFLPILLDNHTIFFYIAAPALLSQLSLYLLGHISLQEALRVHGSFAHNICHGVNHRPIWLVEFSIMALYLFFLFAQHFGIWYVLSTCLLSTLMNGFCFLDYT